MKGFLSTPADSLHRVRPFHMAVLQSLATVLIMLALSFFAADPEIEWLLALASILLYAWAVAVVGFFNLHWKRFMFLAILGYILVNAVSLGAAHFLSDSNFKDLPEFQLMLKAATIFFGVSLFMSRFIRGIREFIDNN